MCCYESVLEEYPVTGEAIKVRRPDHVAGTWPPLQLGIGTGITAPVIGKGKEDIGALGGCCTQSCKKNGKEKKGKSNNIMYYIVISHYMANINPYMIYQKCSNFHKYGLVWTICGSK